MESRVSAGLRLSDSLCRSFEASRRRLYGHAEIRAAEALIAVNGCQYRRVDGDDATIAIKHRAARTAFGGLRAVHDLPGRASLIVPVVVSGLTTRAQPNLQPRRLPIAHAVLISRVSLRPRYAEAIRLRLWETEQHDRLAYHRAWVFVAHRHHRQCRIALLELAKRDVITHRRSRTFNSNGALIEGKNATSESSLAAKPLPAPEESERRDHWPTAEPHACLLRSYLLRP